MLGKRVVRNRPSSAFASRTVRALPVKEAIQADFIDAPSSIDPFLGAPPGSSPAAAAAGASGHGARLRRASLGARAVPAIRKTAVALDPATCQAITVLASSAEITSERPYSSLTCKKGPSFGPKPAGGAFKPFALGGQQHERTELSDPPKGFAEEAVERAKRLSASAAARRPRSATSGRASASRADKWLRPTADAVPGPGAYFVP